MTDMTPHSLQNSALACGCSREDDSAFEWDVTCRLNEAWTLRCAENPFSGPGRTVAVLASGKSTYTFEWSANNAILARFCSPLSTRPFTTATDSVTLDWIYHELLESPDTFTHSSLERAALTEAVARLRRVEESAISYLLQNDSPATPANSDSDGNTTIEDDYIDIDDVATYVQNIPPWQGWKPDNTVATLSGPAEWRPLLQRKGSTEQTLLYEFKLAKDHTLTISTRHVEVDAAWNELAECYKLHRGKGKDFNLTDVICFLQADDKILTSIPPEEVAALKECVRVLATEAVKRLEHPTFNLLRDRSPILQCELYTFTLCLRKEKKEQSVVLIQRWLDSPLYAWTHGHIFQVMTTEARTAVEVSIIYERDGKPISLPKYEIRQHMSELNAQGVYFCCEGLGHAGEILALPKEATPPVFQPAHIS